MNGTWTINYLNKQQKTEIVFFISPNVQINSKWIRLQIRKEQLKLLESNIEEYLYLSSEGSLKKIEGH